MYVYVERNIEARLCNHCCSGKEINITYSECVCIALSIRHAMRMHHVVVYGLSSSQFFCTLSYKRYDFRKKSVDIKYVLLTSTTFV